MTDLSKVREEKTMLAESLACAAFVRELHKHQLTTCEQIQLITNVFSSLLSKRADQESERRCDNWLRENDR